MSLDLGALVGRAIIDDAPFQRTYSRLMRQMADLGRAGERSAAGTATLDESLTATGKAGTTAGAGIDRTTRAATAAAAAEEKAAAAASRHAQSMTRVAAMMDLTAAEGPRVQAATLRVAAAQERLNALQASGTATTRQLAAAQAGLISAQRTLTAAQDTGAVSASRWRSSLMMAGRTALELGLLIGGIEIARKAIEFVAAGKHLTDALNSVQAASHATDTQMRAVRAQAIALGRDLTVPRATAVDAAQAIDDLVRAGMTLPRAMGAARAALLLAAAATVNTADSARVLGDVLDEFKLPASEATKTANILAAAATSSAGGLMAVFEAFTYVGTRARALGLGVQDIAAAIIDLSKAGILGDRAGTGLAMMLQRLASESPKGQKALDDLGVTAWDARGKFVGLPKVIDQLHAAQQRMGTGSQQFIKDVSDAFGARAANVVTAFALRGVEGYNTMYKRLSSGDVEKAAALMNRGAGAGFRQLSKEATAAGIAVYDKLEKPFTSAVMWVGEKLPAAVSTAAHILGPFGGFIGSTLGTAWDLFIQGARVVAAILGPVVHLIDDIRTPLGAVGTAAVAAYFGFKLFSAIPGLLETVALKSMYARDAVIGLGVSSKATATAFVTNSAVVVGAADRTALGIVASGEAARVGWAGILGPIGAVALGIGLIVSLFHHSAAASKEATDAAKEFDTALQAGDQATVLDSIVKQLSDNNVPQKLASMKKQLDAVGISAADFKGHFGDALPSGKDFVNAISQGGDALAKLRARLEEVQSLGTSPLGQLLPFGKSAQTLIRDLDTLSGALTKSQIKEIATYKSLGMVAVAVDQVGSKLHLTSDEVKAYAGMLGLAVTKSGDLVDATLANQQAILAVSQAYNTATQSGDELLNAELAFSKSAGTANDRAALIGATLKSSNGDALAFAASMAATTSAVDTLTGAFEQQRQQLTQQSADQQKASDSVTSAQRAQGSATDRLRLAEQRLATLRGSSKATAAQIAAAEHSVKSAQDSVANSADRLRNSQTAAGKAGVLAYADTERAAIKFRKTSAGLTATIDTNAKGAGDLVGQLQSIQDSAMKAAGAMFQHDRATKGATAAADAAYNIYVSKTKGALIDSARQLGLTKDQAQALAKAYYDTPAHVKTLIEQEGANPVVDVLNKIGRLLAHITGQKWDIPVSISVHNGLPAHPGAAVGRGGVAVGPGHAAGGPINGSGPRGIDSQLTPTAPGEWVMRTLAVDKYGPAFMRSVNNGTFQLPTISMASMANRPAAIAASNSPAGDRYNVEHQELHLHYPEPERPSVALPRVMRNAVDIVGSEF